MRLAIFFCANTGLQGIGSGQPQLRQRSQWVVADKSGMAENLPEFLSRFVAVARGHKSQATHINRVWNWWRRRELELPRLLKTNKLLQNQCRQNIRIRRNGRMYVRVVYVDFRKFFELLPEATMD